MTVELLAALVAACSFGSAFAASAPSTRDAGGFSDAIARAARSLAHAPPVARAIAHADVGRMRGECLRDMPEMLDVVMLGLSAGLSFDASLELYVERRAGVLARELGEAMVLWRLGVLTRAQALAACAERLDLAPMKRFAELVAEALDFGTPLASALEEQAQLIRDEQRASLEEEIERVPVKMLIPLGTLIVPAMLLAILGPLLGPAIQIG